MTENVEIINKAIESSLKIIDQDREREIISRRFGLNGEKETLEQIGTMLNITRERVRQLEKAIMIRLRISAEDEEIKNLAAAEKLIVRNLSELGRVARTETLANKIFGRKASSNEHAGLYFIASISAQLATIDENDHYYSAVSIADYGDDAKLKARVDEIVTTIKKAKKPLTLDELDEQIDGYEHPSYINATAMVSKDLSSLNDMWGLTKWPAVNPRNIRDKIFVILEHEQKPMHFSEIAEAIKDSDFRRKNVTIQAIHNELIKDKRFVLIGRGIYALDNWGYKKGTVSEAIQDVLGKSSKPLTREEIVKRVLKIRKVKETTILLNLQNKKLFEKVDKNHYQIAK